MRQLLNIRFLAAVAALAGLAFLVNEVVADESPIEAVLEPEVVQRRIDLIAPVFATTSSDNFRVKANGETAGFLDLILTGDRVMRIPPGTPGEITCEELDRLNNCAVLADLLGDAVVWFAVLPQAPRATLELPPIIDLEDGYAIFENGWEIVYPPVIPRECDEDIPTFSDFLRRFGPNSTTIVDIELQQIDSVICGPEVGVRVVPTTTVPRQPDEIFELPVGPIAPETTIDPSVLPGATP